MTRGRIIFGVGATMFILTVVYWIDLETWPLVRVRCGKIFAIDYPRGSFASEAETADRLIGRNLAEIPDDLA